MPKRFILYIQAACPAANPPNLMTERLTLECSLLPLSPDELLISLGVRGAASAEMLASAADAIDRARRIAVPRAVGRLFTLDRQDGTLTLAGSTLTLPGRDIADHLRQCSRCLLMAVTLGHAVERELIRLAPNPARAVYFDTACSLLIEAAADAAEARWLSEIAHTSAVFRYSPGYGDLPMSVQPRFLALLDAGRALGLTLTDSGLMIPRKSITAVVGIA